MLQMVTLSSLLGQISQPFNVHNPVGRKGTHTVFAKVAHGVQGVKVCPLWCIMVERVNARRYKLHKATLKFEGK